jgi:hypothetical protein
MPILIGCPAAGLELAVAATAADTIAAAATAASSAFVRFAIKTLLVSDKQTETGRFTHRRNGNARKP